MPRTIDFPYLDDRLVMVNKPPGLVCHRSEINQDRLTLHFMVNERIPGQAFLVNRLDRATSGILVMARDKEAARHCSLAFQERRVRKVYLALVRGWPEQEEFSCERALDGKEAATGFKVLGRVERPWPNDRYPTTRLSFLEVRPATGLFHQIRRHLRALGHPVVGDREHGDKAVNRSLHQSCGIKRLLLHSFRLGLPHPEDQRWLQAEASFPGRLRGLLARLGFDQEMINSLRAK